MERGRPHGTFFEPGCISLVLHCASLTAHNKMAAVKGMQSKRNAIRIFGCVWFLPNWDSTCCWNVHNVSSTRVAGFDFLTGEPRKYTCQVSRLRCDCHACGSKTWISRLLTPVFRFATPGRKVLAITALTDTFWKIYSLFKQTKERKEKSMWMINSLRNLFF